MRKLEMFLGEDLAFELLIDNPKVTSCYACGTRLEWQTCRFTIAYGKPSAVCDVECYEMLKANWQDTKGRV